MHTGHRSRLAGKIKDGGVVYEHELLEYLLFNACPRRDLNATAHSLIQRFGSISGVFAARREELVSVDGVGENMAEYLLCLGKSLSRCGNCNSFAVLRNTADFKSFISTRATGASDCLELCLMDKTEAGRKFAKAGYSAVFPFTVRTGCSYVTATRTIAFFPTATTMTRLAR